MVMFPLVLQYTCMQEPLQFPGELGLAVHVRHIRWIVQTSLLKSIIRNGTPIAGPARGRSLYFWELSPVASWWKFDFPGTYGALFFQCSTAGSGYASSDCSLWNHYNARCWWYTLYVKFPHLDYCLAQDRTAREGWCPVCTHNRARTRMHLLTCSFCFNWLPPIHTHKINVFRWSTHTV